MGPGVVQQLPSAPERARLGVTVGYSGSGAQALPPKGPGELTGVGFTRSLIYSSVLVPPPTVFVLSSAVRTARDELTRLLGGSAVNSDFYIRDDNKVFIAAHVFDGDSTGRGCVTFMTSEGNVSMYLDVAVMRQLCSALTDELGPEFLPEPDDVLPDGRDDVSTMRRILARKSPVCDHCGERVCAADLNGLATWKHSDADGNETSWFCEAGTTDDDDANYDAEVNGTDRVPVHIQLENETAAN